ncbi:hypothetical protein Thiowin_02494 [Thiorhodovibrio winogradskyi]|jgi:MFS family permease|uniref:DUF2721 domain-containing protein n=1 Tax=Thiorhodovibrio winogradskyi TaxID=77007 RepID=A0ABZ0SAA3_9GAMM|nr:DUF2721 domain-containing protein [Thiorhodovibrio winogradskyi]
MSEIDTGMMAHSIQLAVAPVFLLTGIGALLGVMAGRIARVIDRSRKVEALLASTIAETDPARTRAATEMRRLQQRARLISLAIGFCTLAALLVVFVIAVLFLGAFWQLEASLTVAGLFIAAMGSLTLALVLFLREVMIATADLCFGRGLDRRPERTSAPPPGG